MFKVISRKDIDIEKWNLCVNQNPNIPTIYANSWFLDIVCPKWKAIIWNNYETVFPLPEKNKFNFITYLAQPYFTQQLGIYGKKLDQLDWNQLIKFLNKRYYLIDIQLNENNLNDTALRKRLNLCLTKTENYTSNYSNNVKRNIKKAIQSNLKIIENKDYQPLITFFQSQKSTEYNIKAKAFIVLENICSELASKNLGHFLTCINERNEIISSGIFIKWNHRTIFLNGTSNAEGRENGAMHLLINCSINTLCKNEETFDFEGSNNPNLARFYKSFGAEERHYYQIKNSFFNSLFNKFK